MTLQGTVVNGIIVLSGNPTLPEGARVRVELEEVFEYPHPLAPYDQEKELALLSERIRATSGGIPLKEGMARVAGELNLPPVEPE